MGNKFMYKVLVYTLGYLWLNCYIFSLAKKVLVMELFEKFKQFRDSFLGVSNWFVKRKKTWIKMHSYYSTK